jgi:hypothetical protein
MPVWQCHLCTRKERWISFWNATGVLSFMLFIFSEWKCVTPLTVSSIGYADEPVPSYISWFVSVLKRGWNRFFVSWARLRASCVDVAIVFDSLYRRVWDHSRKDVIQKWGCQWWPGSSSDAVFKTFDPMRWLKKIIIWEDYFSYFCLHCTRETKPHGMKYTTWSETGKQSRGTR